MAWPTPRNTVSSLGDARFENTIPPQASSDITRVVLFVLVIGTLLAGSFWTLLPFLSGLIWATTIVIATWPHCFGWSGWSGDGVRWRLRS
jgi:hypothetical protein